MTSIFRLAVAAVAAVCFSMPVFADNAENSDANANLQQQLAASNDTNNVSGGQQIQDQQANAGQQNQTGGNTASNESVNINSADSADIVKTLKGFNKKKADAIVAYRTQNGPFKSVDDLLKVKGISKKLIEKNRNRITVG